MKRIELERPKVRTACTRQSGAACSCAARRCCAPTAPPASSCAPRPPPTSRPARGTSDAMQVWYIISRRALVHNKRTKITKYKARAQSRTYSALGGRRLLRECAQLQLEQRGVALLCRGLVQHNQTQRLVPNQWSPPYRKRIEERCATAKELWFSWRRGVTQILNVSESMFPKTSTRVFQHL